MVYQPVPTQAGGTRYGNRYLNYQGLVPSQPGTMGSDSQPGGGGGAPGTLGSASYTPPPAGQAGAQPPPPPTGAPPGVAGSGVADTVQSFGGVGDSTQTQVEGAGFRQRVRPEDDPFAGGQLAGAAQEEQAAVATSPVQQQLVQQRQQGRDDDPRQPARQFGTSDLGVTTQTGGGRTFTGQGSEGDPAARADRRAAAESLGYEVGQTSPAAAAAGALGILSPIPGVGTAANFAVDKLGLDQTSGPQRGDFGTIDPGSGAVYGPEGRAYDPVSGAALNVYDSAEDFGTNLQDSYSGLRQAGVSPVQAGLGSYQNSIHSIGRGARDQGVTAASHFGGLRNIAGEQSIADVLSGDSFTPVVDDGDAPIGTLPELPGAPQAPAPAPKPQPAPLAAPKREKKEKRERTAFNQAARSRDTQRSISQSSFDKAIADAKAGKKFETKTISKPKATTKSTPKTREKKEKKSKGGK